MRRWDDGARNLIECDEWRETVKAATRREKNIYDAIIIIIIDGGCEFHAITLWIIRDRDDERTLLAAHGQHWQSNEN